MTKSLSMTGLLYIKIEKQVGIQVNPLNNKNVRLDKWFGKFYEWEEVFHPPQP